jgi:hypothetical protein
VASAHRQGQARDGAARGRYVASLLWSGLPRAANDNSPPFRLQPLLPVAAGVVLLIVAIWSAVS